MQRHRPARQSGHSLSNEGPRVTASGGYATMDASRPSAKQLVREADTCLYEVKSRGGHRTVTIVAGLVFLSKVTN